MVEPLSGPEMRRKLRHDVRGALSPALLLVGRLVEHEDPRVVRAGRVIAESIEKASGLLADPVSSGET